MKLQWSEATRWRLLHLVNQVHGSLFGWKVPELLKGEDQVEEKEKEKENSCPAASPHHPIISPRCTARERERGRKGKG